jgi:hypothetical protein
MMRASLSFRLSKGQVAEILKAAHLLKYAAISQLAAARNSKCRADRFSPQRSLPTSDFRVSKTRHIG